MKTIKLTILTTAITLLILTYATYRIMDGCHPKCTPRFTHGLMRSLGADDPKPTPWPSPMQQDYHRFFGQPTLTPRPSTNQ